MHIDGHIQTVSQRRRRRFSHFSVPSVYRYFSESSKWHKYFHLDELKEYAKSALELNKAKVKSSLYLGNGNQSKMVYIGILLFLYILIGIVPIQSAILRTENPASKSYTYVVALVGGGSNPQPGEISLAHNGVLFCDELPEFQRSTLEVLRQPLEDRVINISRAKYSISYPCSFMFVASMNPCPCGYYNHPTKQCCCTPGQIVRYLNKISGPLLDRIDIQCEITPLSFEELSRTAPGESSATIRERVVRARKIQEERFKDEPGVHCNAQMTSRLMHRYAEPAPEDMDMLREAMNRLQLSARAYDRILRVARTIADLDGSEHIQPHHLQEAIGYRNLDRSSWGE